MKTKLMSLSLLFGSAKRNIGNFGKTDTIVCYYENTPCLALKDNNDFNQIKGCYVSFKKGNTVTAGKINDVLSLGYGKEIVVRYYEDRQIKTESLNNQYWESAVIERQDENGNVIDQLEL